MKATVDEDGFEHAVGGRPFGACRVCDVPTFTRDLDGPVHVCCAREGEGCRSCAASRAAKLARARR